MGKTDDMKRQREEWASAKAREPVEASRVPASVAPKQGRPVGGGETLNWTVQAMVTKQERLEAAVAADKAGVTLSTWIRKLVLAALKEGK